ncbi:hypothetical protein NFI96_019613, partial [Prochilodus magdalenae]
MGAMSRRPGVTPPPPIPHNLQKLHENIVAWEVSTVVEERYSSGEKAVSMTCCAGFDGPQSSTRGECLEEEVSRICCSLYTHDCIATHSSNTISKFADDATIIGNIPKDDEGPYREEVKLLTEWCATNNLCLNVSQTKELIIDFRKRGRMHTPLNIGGTLVERKGPTTPPLSMKAEESQAATVAPLQLLQIQRKTLQRVVKTAQHITATTLPPIREIYDKRCLRKAVNISSDPTHSSHPLFQPLPSRKRVFKGLRNGISTWYSSCSVAKRRARQRVINTARKIIGFPSSNILKDPFHPGHHLFNLLPSESQPFLFVQFQVDFKAALIQLHCRETSRSQSDPRMRMGVRCASKTCTNNLSSFELWRALFSSNRKPQAKYTNVWWRFDMVRSPLRTSKPQFSWTVQKEEKLVELWSEQESLFDVSSYYTTTEWKKKTGGQKLLKPSKSPGLARARVMGPSHHK